MQTGVPLDFTVEECVYHTPRGIPLIARIYRPKTEHKTAAVVDAHGGRWCAEDRLTNQAIDRTLAASGVLVMAIDFRVPPEGRYPLPVSDINFAVRWLKHHASELNVDPNRIGAVGTSSGGHQLLLTALRPDDPAFTVDQPPMQQSASLAFLIACWPVSDPAKRYHYALSKDMHDHVACHEAYWANRDQMEAGSPIRLVRERQATHWPPLLLIQGTEDVILSPGMSEDFAEAYAEQGAQVTLKLYDGQGHTFITKDPTTVASHQAIADMIAFIGAQPLPGK